jgi:CopA family copper-resistance protein
VNRRKFLQSSLLTCGALGWQALLPAWAQTAAPTPMAGVPGLQGNNFDLTVAAARSAIAGTNARHITVNGQFPSPLLRWREGEALTLRVHNMLDESTSIHWHGILLPWQMDGVPGVSFPGIAKGETFTYRFPLKQAGTYWYHSHSGLQEQIGHYGPLIIDPLQPEPYQYEREYVVLLSDWSTENPERVFARLKKMSDSYNYQQRTVFDFFRDVRADGLDATLAERMMWGDMRMNATDLADVTAATYTYLVNGHSPAENWTALFNPGERIRLRFINASAMSIFNIRIPGMPMSVVQADGLDVQPVITDEFQIGTAETFDVIVQPQADQAYSIYAESNDRYGYAAATLAPRPGMRAAVPALRPRPLLTMKDMGMDHGAHAAPAAAATPGMDHSTMDHSAMDHSAMDHSAMDHSAMDHSAMDHSAMDHGAMMAAMAGGMMMGHAGHEAAAATTGAVDHSAHAASDIVEALVDHSAHAAPATAPQAHPHAMGAGVASVASNPVNRLHERPLGLEHEAHRVLVYTDLRSLAPNPDQRAPGRELELHLTANMERYMWSFDGLKFSEVADPIPLVLNERVRMTFVNDTMMPHPVHLHGMFFELVTGETTHKPRKHTLVLKPGEKASIDVTADAAGEWAFHCHLLYHMHAGMMRVFAVTGQAGLS